MDRKNIIKRTTTVRLPVEAHEIMLALSQEGNTTQSHVMTEAILLLGKKKGVGVTAAVK